MVNIVPEVYMVSMIINIHFVTIVEETYCYATLDDISVYITIPRTKRQGIITVIH
jgi:hypothetical protein